MVLILCLVSILVQILRDTYFSAFTDDVQSMKIYEDLKNLFFTREEIQ